MQFRTFLLLMLVAGCESKPAPEEQPLAVDTHDSRNSLDWSGTYRGVTPCADCEGIETSIVLLEDGSFKRRRNYLGRQSSTMEDRGTFVWDEAGSKVTLEAKDGSTQMYQVGEKALYHLDQTGNRVTGDLADRYELRKQHVP